MFASGLTNYGVNGVSIMPWKEDVRIVVLGRNVTLVIKNETYMYSFWIVLSY